MDNKDYRDLDGEEEYHNVIEIKNMDGEVIFTSETAQNIKEAVEEAVRLKVSLAYADLEEADLEEADLRRADFKNAYLFFANLKGAHLEGACLKKADLRCADLCGADFRGADFRGAYCKGAIRHDTDFGGADLECAEFY